MDPSNILFILLLFISRCAHSRFWLIFNMLLILIENKKATAVVITLNSKHSNSHDCSEKQVYPCCLDLEMRWLSVSFASALSTAESVQWLAETNRGLVGKSLHLSLGWTCPLLLRRVKLSKNFVPAQMTPSVCRYNTKVLGSSLDSESNQRFLTQLAVSVSFPTACSSFEGWNVSP